MSFSLPDLPYAYDALAPYLSRETMEFHHDKHHQAYVTAGNNHLRGTDLQDATLEEIVEKSYGVNNDLFNNAAQHFNHTHFWKWMKPGSGKIPSGLEKRIVDGFGSVAKMKEEFIQAGIAQFGSGWVWLAVKTDNKYAGTLTIRMTQNAVNPLVTEAWPILGCDIWEHAYYLDYHNRRADYLKAFLEHLVNWDYVDELLGYSGG